MKHLLVLFCVLFLFAAPARAQDPAPTPTPAPATSTGMLTDSWPLHLAVGGYMTLNGVDLSQTMYCIGQTTCSEQSPFMRHFTDHPAVFGALKMGLDSAAVYGIIRIHHDRPKLAWLLTGLGLVAEGAVVISNNRYIHSAR